MSELKKIEAEIKRRTRWTKEAEKFIRYQVNQLSKLEQRREKLLKAKA